MLLHAREINSFDDAVLFDSNCGVLREADWLRLHMYRNLNFSACRVQSHLAARYTKYKKFSRDEIMINELKFHDLSVRHFGLTPEVSAYYAQAACVCLDRHHTPKVEFRINDNLTISSATAAWPPVGDRIKAAWNNVTDTTEAGAYAIALAAVELSRGLVAIRRAETATGADYYIDKPDAPVVDLETSLRLEISGVDAGNDAEVRRRLKRKLKQARAGNSNLPAIACVVGFAALHIAAMDVS